MNNDNMNYNNVPQHNAPAYTAPAYPAPAYNAPVYNAPVYKPTGVMKTSSRVIRLITLCLFVVAMLTYYLPTLLNEGFVGIVWLVVGVVQTVVFSAIFFRDARTRTALSIVLMVFFTLCNIVLALFVGFMFLMTMGLGLNLTAALIYVSCILIAGIFALCFPRRYHMIQVNPTATQGYPQPHGYQQPQGYTQSHGYQQPPQGYTQP